MASVQQLAGLAHGAASEAVRVSAIALLFERGWGKAAQPVTGPDGDNLEVIIRHIVEQHQPTTITVHPKRINGDNGDDDT